MASPGGADAISMTAEIESDEFDAYHAWEPVMPHVVEAVYENGVLKPDHPLPLRDREKVRVTVESIATTGHSVLDIPPISLGKTLQPPTTDDDILSEMLEGRP